MARRTVALVVLALALAGLSGGSSLAVSPEAAADVELMVSELERIHPSPYHAVSRADFRDAADGVISRLPGLSEDELLVELVRLVARLGEREGHTTLHPLSTSHRRGLHLFPIVPYSFSDGVYVAAAPGRQALVGRRLVAVDGRPLAEVLALVDPLVARDNAWSLEAHRGPYLVSAELLHGLGVTASASAATFTFEAADGTRSDARLTAVRALAYSRLMRPWYPLFVDGMPKRPRPLLAAKKHLRLWQTTLARGRAIYVGYNSVFARTDDAAERLRRAARRPEVRRIVIDLRNNGGGDIGTYPPLLDALRSKRVRKPGRIVLLIGRTTFSAAVHFAVDARRLTGARLVGEPAGGSPNHYGETDPVPLPVSGYEVRWPRHFWEKLPGRPGLVLEPDVAVPLTGRDFFAGRDPVLARALALR